VILLWLGFRPEGPISGSPGRSPGSGAPPKTGFLGLKGRSQGVCVFAVMYGVRGAYAPGSAETGPSGLVETLGCRDQVLTHLALLRSALQAWGSGPSGHVFCLCRACVCVSGLKGRFPVAQGAALGPEPPQKNWSFRPEGPISRRACFRGPARGPRADPRLSRGCPAGTEVPPSVHATPEIP